MTKNKQEAYSELVKKRKEFNFMEIKNPSQINNGEYVIELFNILDIDIGSLSNPNKSALTLFTNAILGIKDNRMSSSVKAIKSIYNLKEESVLKDLIHTNPIEVDNKRMFSFYHCGGLGLANRNLEL